MSFGMTKTKGKPSKKKALPQGDKSMSPFKGGKLPMRDGPAKDAPNGKDAGKPKTSAKAKPSKKMAAMKASLAGVGKF